MRYREIIEGKLDLTKGNMLSVPMDGPIKLTGFGSDSRADPADVEQFLDEWEGMTSPNPMVRGQRIYGDAVISLDNWGGAIKITDIRSLKKGAGSIAMTAVCQLADRHGVPLELYAKGYADVPTEKLVPFYRRFGFEISGDSGEGVDMFRDPN
jgi:hypothetical protein